jgi:hypothetical protein
LTEREGLAVTLDTDALFLVGFFGAGILFIGWYVARALTAHRRRASQVRQWCDAAGFRYQEDPVEASTLAPMRALAPDPEHVEGRVAAVARVVSVTAERMALGTRDGVPLTIFDQVRTARSDSGSRSTGTARSQTRVLIEGTGPELPGLWFMVASVGRDSSFASRTVGAAAAVAASFATDGLARVKLPGHPGLLLRSEDPARAQALFEPLCDFFADKSGWGIEAEGRWMTVGCDPAFLGKGWYRRPLMDYVAVEKYDEFLARALQIAEQVRAAAAAG